MWLWENDKSFFPSLSALWWMWGSPESARAQAQLCGGTRGGTWRWMQESSTLLSACLGQPLPASGRVPGCLGPCLGAFDAGSAAERAGQGDRGSLGWTDPCWRGNLASQMSPHPRTSEGGDRTEQHTQKISFFFFWMGERSSTSLWCSNLPQLSHTDTVWASISRQTCVLLENQVWTLISAVMLRWKQPSSAIEKNKQAIAF